MPFDELDWIIDFDRLWPEHVCVPSEFGPLQSEPRDKDVPIIIRYKHLNWDNRLYNFALEQLWSPRPLEYEISQLNQATVPQHLFKYRDLITEQILIIREVPSKQKTLELIAKQFLLLSERDGLNYLIKEHYRTYFSGGEPPRLEFEKQIGARFGDLVHGKDERHEIHNWPCYVVAIERYQGEDFIWVRKSLNHPGKRIYNPDPEYWFRTPEDVLRDDYVKYKAEYLTRLPPIAIEAEVPYSVEYSPKTTADWNKDDYRNHFPNVRTKPKRWTWTPRRW